LPDSTLKTRLIGTILIRDGIAVQSYGFRRHLPIGRPEIAVDYLNRWGIDEIVLLDIRATPERRGFDLALLKRCAACCQVPLAVGGGIRQAGDVADLLNAGADKVVINAAAATHPELITATADRYGAQCVIVSIDATEDGRTLQQRTAVEAARQAQAAGAGEILLNAIHCDGAAQGYDLALIESVSAAVNIPVIALGGAGCPQHFAAAFATGASALAAANLWHHSEHSVVTVKHFLQRGGEVPVRIDTACNYAGFAEDSRGRIAMTDEAALEELRFAPLAEDEALA
jgi:cyclase